MSFWNLVLAISLGVALGRIWDGVIIGIINGIKKNRARYKQ